MPARTVRSSGKRSRSTGAEAVPPLGRTLPTVSAVRYGTEGLRLKEAVRWLDLPPPRAGPAGQRRPRLHEPPRQQVEPSRSEEHTSELQSRPHLVCRLLLEKKKT